MLRIRVGIGEMRHLRGWSGRGLGISRREAWGRARGPARGSGERLMVFKLCDSRQRFRQTQRARGRLVGFDPSADGVELVFGDVEGDDVRAGGADAAIRAEGDSRRRARVVVI